MLRFFVALSLLVTISHTAVAGECVPKDKFRAELEARFPKLVHMDINGEHEKIFLANMSKMTGEDLLSYDAVIYRNPGFKTTLIMFFKDGCAELQSELPNDAVTPSLGRDA